MQPMDEHPRLPLETLPCTETFKDKENVDLAKEFLILEMFRNTTVESIRKRIIKSWRITLFPFNKNDIVSFSLGLEDVLKLDVRF